MAGSRMHRSVPVPLWLVVALCILGLGGPNSFGQVEPQVSLGQAEPQAEQVVKVLVVGRQKIPLEKIVNHIRTRAGRPLDMEQIEEDVRRLNQTRMFVSIRPLTKKVEGGRLVIFEVVERPVMQYVKFVGNQKIRKTKLAEEAEIKEGDALDPFAVEEGRRKIEEFYRSHGFTKAHVTVFEGDEYEDRGVVYLINEGTKQRVLWTYIKGNTIASDARLKTQIQSKPGILWLVKGEVDRKQIDEDVNRLKAYYSSLGYLGARVGRELSFSEGQEWLTLTFVIDEGPRYKVREIHFQGNERFSDESLSEMVELKGGEYFNQSQLNADVSGVQEKYGSQGYVFADVKPTIRYLEAGKLDLVYDVKEGDRYRVGRIDVEIRGGDVAPHTQITTVLNRMSLHPGDIVDIRELRASERRLRASGLFLTEPQRGVVPKIVFSPPELSDEEILAKREKEGEHEGRGQSPDYGASNEPPAKPLVVRFRGQWADRGAIGRAEEEAAASPNRRSIPSYSVQPSYTPQPGYGPQSRADRLTLPSPVAPAGTVVAHRPISMPAPVPVDPRQLSQTAWREQRAAGGDPPYRVVRAQSPSYLPSGGRATPGLTPNAYPTQYPTSPNSSSAPYATAPSTGTYQAPPAGTYQAPAAGAYQAPPAGTAGAPAYTAPGSTATQPGVVNPNQSLTAQPAVPSPMVANPAPLPTEPSPDGSQPYFPNGVMADGSVFNGEPLRDLPITAIAEEARTGRIMLGVGINSDAGLIGSVVIDEQNFDLFRVPHSWEDVRSGKAFRGAGQRLRLEAVPGTQVQRYMATFTEPYWMRTNVSTSFSGFFYNRIYEDWSEERLGGSIRLGYQFRPDLVGNIAFRGERVSIYDPSLSPAVLAATVPDLYEALGDNDLYGFRVGLSHDTRDSAFLPTEGHLIDVGFEQVLGTYQYPRGDIDLRKYFTLHQRADGSGRHVLSLSASFGITGQDTPIYDHFFAGGFSSIRGFDFRGASPVENTVIVGGHMQMLGSIQYMFPVTADDMLRLVAFCDVGTVEQDYTIHGDNFRVAPGFGLRVTIPAMGPAPLAFDFAFPVAKADTDTTEVFSFFIGLGR